MGHTGNMRGLLLLTAVGMLLFQAVASGQAQAAKRALPRTADGQPE